MYQPVVHGDAVQQHLKGVLVRIPVRFGCNLRFGRTRSIVHIPEKRLKAAQIAAFLEQLLRQLRAVLGGAGPDKTGHAHGLQLLAQGLDAGAFVAALRQRHTLRCRALALPQLGHVLQIVVKKGHRHSLTFQTNILSYRGCQCKKYRV